METARFVGAGTRSPRFLVIVAAMLVAMVLTVLTVLVVAAVFATAVFVAAIFCVLVLFVLIVFHKNLLFNKSKRFNLFVVFRSLFGYFVIAELPRKANANRRNLDLIYKADKPSKLLPPRAYNRTRCKSKE